MQFDGTTTTPGGVTAQNLVTALESLGQNTVQVTTAGSSVLLWRLYAARPDLRDEIFSSLGEAAAEPEQIWNLPMLVHGGDWEKTLTYIGTYSGVEPRLSWKFLTKYLHAGSTFSYQLWPTLYPDVVLRCRVYRTTTVTTAAGTFMKALDCLYTLDYGITTAIDDYGNPIGYLRTFDYGRVIYVPEVGPVYSYERRSVQPGDPPSEGALDITIDLTASSTLDQ
jgi:hypothetical protein